MFFLFGELASCTGDCLLLCLPLTLSTRSVAQRRLASTSAVLAEYAGPCMPYRFWPSALLCHQLSSQSDVCERLQVTYLFSLLFRV